MSWSPSRVTSRYEELHVNVESADSFDSSASSGPVHVSANKMFAGKENN
jgi:hypothetical protein